MDLIYPHAKQDLTTADLLDIYHWPAERSYLRANMVATIDGSVRDAYERADGISGPADKEVFKVLRHTADAVLVGAGTVIAENYGPMPVRDEWVTWRAENSRAAAVPIVIATNSAHISPTARVFGEPNGGAMVAVPESADRDRVAALREVAEVIVLGADTLDIPGLLATLAERGLTRVLTEGGPTFLSTAMAWLDELCLTTTGMVLGATADPARHVPDLLGGHRTVERRATLGSVIAAEDTLLVSWKFEK